MIRSAKLPVYVSLVMTAALLLTLCASLFLIPMAVDTYIEMKSADFSAAETVMIKVIIYLMTLPAFAAMLSLLRLLNNVRRSRMFASDSVICLFIISLCCFSEALLFIFLGFYFLFSFIVAFAALFMGVCMSVVTVVVEEGRRIKAENDMTI